MAETAKKKHPEKWERAKRKARKKMGGHSARAMQLATNTIKRWAVNMKVKNQVKINFLSGVKKIGKLVKNMRRRKKINVDLCV